MNGLLFIDPPCILSSHADCTTDSKYVIFLYLFQVMFDEKFDEPSALAELFKFKTAQLSSGTDPRPPTTDHRPDTSYSITCGVHQGKN